MDVSKVTAALATARVELRNAIGEARKTLADQKADVSAVADASRALGVAARIDTALTKADSKIVTALKKLAPRAKKAKAPKAKKAA